MRRWDFAVVGGASIFLLLGALFFGLGVRNAWRALESPRWPTAQGIVARSDSAQNTTRERRTGAESTIYSADISFRYKVDSRDFTTSIRHFGQIEGSGDSSEAELLRLRYPEKGIVRVFYNPRDPSVAAVEPGFDAELLWLPGAGLAFAVPAVMFIVLWFGMSRGDRGFAIGLGIFAGIFAAIGAIFLIAGISNLWRGYQSRTWPRVTGTIVYGRVDTSESVTTDDDGDTTRSTTAGARIIYRYEVDGQTHYSNIRTFGQLAGSSGNWAEDIAARYRKGSEVSIAYSRDNPRLATLETGIARESLWLPGAGAAWIIRLHMGHPSAYTLLIQGAFRQPKLA